jgi:hypothetical protein
MRLASSVLVVPRPSPGTGHHIQLTRKVQDSEVITGRECHDHTWYDFSKKAPTLLNKGSKRGVKSAYHTVFLRREPVRIQRCLLI